MSPPKRIVVAFRIPEALRDVLAGITDYAKNAGHNWQVLCVDPEELESTLSRHRADGAMTVVPPRASRTIRRLQRFAIPVVNMLHDLTPRIASVLSDDQAIGHTGAKYLIQRGFSQTGFVGVEALWSHDRAKGFSAAIAGAGLPPPLALPPLPIGDFRFLSTDHAVKTLRRWLRKTPRPIAIMTACDFAARALIQACHAQNLNVPRDVAVLGVDNFHIICELSPTPITSVAQDFTKIGFEAARLLALLMQKKLRPPFARLLISPGPIAVRQSTDIFAFEDESVVAALGLIHAHAATGISMKQLLRQIPLSRKWLDQRFKTVVGHTPSQEIRMRRLEFVRNLLIETSMPLSQIVARCEFSCSENLIRYFRDAYGMPPQRYRQSHRQPNSPAATSSRRKNL